MGSGRYAHVGRHKVKGDVDCATCKDLRFRCRHCLRPVGTDRLGRTWSCGCSTMQAAKERCPDCNGGILHASERKWDG